MDQETRLWDRKVPYDWNKLHEIIKVREERGEETGYLQGACLCIPAGGKLKGMLGRRMAGGGALGSEHDQRKFSSFQVFFLCFLLISGQGLISVLQVEQQSCQLAQTLLINTSWREESSSNTREALWLKGKLAERRTTPHILRL